MFFLRFIIGHHPNTSASFLIVEKCMKNFCATSSKPIFRKLKKPDELNDVYDLLTQSTHIFTYVEH